ncbi:MAG: hypothetical protein IT445_17605 [Phycisphaeraceae bacterium]|nr:hypothetical protein [Phycisphaeraceae bacterium]
MSDPHDYTLDEILKRPCPRPTFPEQNADGIDLSLIRANLKLTPTQRVRCAEQYADDILRLIEIGRKHHSKSA